MIMERFGVSALRAFELLRKLSQDSNTPLHQIARDIVARGPDRGGESPWKPAVELTNVCGSSRIHIWQSTAPVSEDAQDK